MSKKANKKAQPSAAIAVAVEEEDEQGISSIKKLEVTELSFSSEIWFLFEVSLFNDQFLIEYFGIIEGSQWNQRHRHQEFGSSWIPHNGVDRTILKETFGSSQRHF